VILRVLNFVVIGVLVLAAAWVYQIKFDATVQAERLAKLRGEMRHERDSIAALRAQWGQLDNPVRIEALAKRYLQLRTIAPTQFDTLDRLPDRAPRDAAATDPIAGMIENLPGPDATGTTGSIPAGAATSDGAGQAPSPAASGALPQ
jgi:hypothetical protein